MDPRVTYKDITLGTKTYRLNKMDPRLACYLFATIAGASTPGALLLFTLGKFPKEKFDEIQNYALRHVLWMDIKDGNVFPTTLISGDGKWGDPDLANDPSKLMDLTGQCVLFNIEPFLEKNPSTDQP